MSEDYASVDKHQLISMIHFLEKRDEESKRENEKLKALIKELQEAHNQRVKSQTDLKKTQSNLVASVDRLTNQVADLTRQNRILSEGISGLLSD